VKLLRLQKTLLAQHAHELPNFIAEDQRALGSREELLHVQLGMLSVQALQGQDPRRWHIKNCVGVMEGITDQQARTVSFR
jgi:hypothetical protein